MRQTSAALAVLAALAFAPPPAVADPAYTSQTVIDVFAKQALGKPRALCVGDESECPAPEETPRFDLLVTFDFNSDRLTPEAKENLNQFALALKDPRLSTQTFAIDGHTDATGSESYNLGLSERRARAVVAYLKTLGLDASRLNAKGFGKSKPRVADPFDPVNRRVETRLDQ
jgi:outer membrane protein OmpA-like peptidoglycan-associated protein